MKHRSVSNFIFRKNLLLSLAIIFLAGMVLTLFVSFSLFSNIQKDERVRFEFETFQILKRIENRMEHYEAALIQTRAFFMTTPNVSREQFHQYFLRTELLERYPGIQGLGFALRIESDQITKHQQQVKKELPNYKIWPSSPRDIYFPIVYLEPQDWRNQKAMGYDMYSEPIRREAMNRAMDDNKAIISAKVQLVQEVGKEKQPGFNFYLPVYKPGMPIANAEQRRKAMLGFIYSPFRSYELFNSLSEDLPKDITFAIYDGKASEASALLYDKGGATTNSLELRKKLKMGGRTYLIILKTLPSFHQRFSYFQVLLSLSIGASTTLLLLWVFLANRRQLEVSENLKYQAYLNKTITENAASSLFMLDENGHPTFMNPAAEKLTGYRLEEIKDHHLHYTIHYKKEDGSEYPLEACPIDRALKELKSIQNQEEVFTDKKGRTFSASYSVRPLVNQGRATGAVLELIDIEERKRAEKELKDSREKLKHALEGAAMGSWYINLRNHSASGSLELSKLFGVDKFEGDFFVTLENLVHPDDKASVIANVDQSIKDNTPYIDEYRIIRPDNKVRWILSKGSPTYDSEGKPLTLSGVLQDITERKLAEESLRDALYARDEFLSIASHELKTPLTSLRLQAQMFKRGIMKEDPSIYRPQKLEGLVNLLDKQVSRLNRLVDDMLDVSRIRSGKLTIEREKFNLCDLVSEVIERLKGQFDAASVMLPTIERCEDAIGEWDRIRLEQVIINLLTNAIKYGEKKAIQVEVKSIGEEICLQVRDQGMGISEDAQKRIFARFERAVNSSEVTGLGLGLFITKQIVVAHGGRIWVESEMGKGATFYVQLPKHKPEGSSIEEVEVI